MGNPLILKTMTNRHRSFYPTIGPFLSRRDIVKELGGPIWDDDDKTWWVAKDDRTVAGFAAACPTPAGIRLLSTYVRPDYRRRGIHRSLLTAQIAAYPGQPLRATCTEAALPLFTHHGFTVLRQRGAYTDVQLTEVQHD